MSARDELQKVIFQSMRLNTQIDLKEDRRLKGSQLAWAGYAADSVLNAGYQTQASLAEEGYRKPRTITTAEELDALVEGSVVLSNGGEDSAQKDGEGYWYLWGGDTGLCPEEIALPATVLHDPEASGE